MRAAAARHRWPLALSLAGAILLAFACFSRIQVRSDLADLLPQGESQASRILMRQLRTGTAGSLILIGVDGAGVDRLAAISDGMAAHLRQSGLFKMVNNGHEILSDETLQALFRNR